jgi:hypothetical protein
MTDSGETSGEDLDPGSPETQRKSGDWNNYSSEAGGEESIIEWSGHDFTFTTQDGEECCLKRGERCELFVREGGGFRAVVPTKLAQQGGGAASARSDTFIHVSMLSTPASKATHRNMATIKKCGDLCSARRSKRFPSPVYLPYSVAVA